MDGRIWGRGGLRRSSVGGVRGKRVEVVCMTTCLASGFEKVVWF